MNFVYRAKYEESQQISLSLMDAGVKKKKGKDAIEGAIKENEAIRHMQFHAMTIEELEDKFDTNIGESK